MVDTLSRHLGKLVTANAKGQRGAAFGAAAAPTGCAANWTTEKEEMSVHDNTTTPKCPHCGHEMTHDEMYYGGDVDLFALAPQEDSTVIECPVCDKQYWVKGGYVPQYTSAFAEEDM